MSTSARIGRSSACTLVLGRVDVLISFVQRLHACSHARMQVVRVGVEDKIAQVFLTTIELVKAILEAVTRNKSIRHNQVVSVLEPVSGLLCAVWVVCGLT